MDMDATESPAAHTAARTRSPAAGSTAKPSPALVAFVATLPKLLHVAPVGLIQFTDYLTDVLVVSTFFLNGDAVAGWAGAAFIGASIVAAWFYVVAVDDLPSKVKWVAVLLAPLNLHVLYVGWTYTAAQGELAAAEDGVMQSQACLEVWQRVRAAVRRVEATANARDRHAYKRAREELDVVTREAQRLGECAALLKQQKTCDELYRGFAIFKAIEAGVESVPLAALTVAQVFKGDAMEDFLAVMASSLTLSVISMAYGFFCMATQKEAEGAQEGNRQDRTIGRRTMLFVSLLVSVSWALAAIGMCLGSSALAPPANYILAFLPALTQAVCMFAVSSTDDGFGVAFVFVVTVGWMSGLLGTAADWFVLRGDSMDNPLWSVSEDTFWVFIATPVSRRLSLLAIAVAAVASEFSTWRVCVLAIGFVLDSLLFAWTWMLYAGKLGHRSMAEQTDAVEVLLGVGASPSAGVEENAAVTVEDGGMAAAELGGDTQMSTDLLSAVCKHAQNALQRAAETPGSGGAQPLAVLETLQELLAVATSLEQQHQSLSPAQRSAIEESVNCYVPSEGGEAELALLAQLRRVQGGEGGGEGERVGREAEDGIVQAEAAVYKHPLHATLLLHGLLQSIWTTVPSFFGSKVEGTAFELSFPTPSCDYFVSHAWKDDGKRKVAMLRAFLCVQALVARMITICLILAAFLAPAGLAVQAQWHAFPWWAPSCVVLAILALLLLWVAASMYGLAPSAYTPWALSSTTVWIDKLCINQASDETKQAGVDSFPMVLANCDRMVALISKHYFSRIWCVFELATFARSKPESLLLFSLDWPSSMSPFKQAELTSEELALLAGFSCENAECYLPKDRVTVLRSIREHFGSEQAFDDYVHTELPGVLQRSKQKYQSQMARVAKESLELSLGA